MSLNEVYLEIDNLERDGAPLYVLRPTGIGPIGAYVTLSADGEVQAQTEDEIDVQDSVYERLVRLELPANVRGLSLLDRLESDECINFLDRVYTGHCIIGEGRDRRGSFSHDARVARSSLLQLLGVWAPEHLVNIAPVARFLNPGHKTDFFSVWPPEMNLAEAIEFTKLRASQKTGMELVGDIKGSLLAAARTAVIRGMHVRLIQRQALIEEGILLAEDFSIKPEDAQCAAKGEHWIVKHAGALRYRVNAMGLDAEGVAHEETWTMQSKDAAVKSAEAWVRRNEIVAKLEPQLA